MHMNTRILEAIGKYVDANYLTRYEVEGYFGFAYLKVPTGEGSIIVWEFFIDSNNELQRVERDSSQYRLSTHI
jgi:hypothetical protein